MPSASPPRFTLLIPTYNRPAYLRSLLGYLAARRFSYPVRVLDSSSGEALAQNRGTIAGVALEIRHAVYDSAIPFFKKLEAGVLSVETRYCALCADDDILTSDLDPFLDALEADPSLAAAQGYYVNFKPGDIFDVSDIVYRAPSIEGDDALERICRQMGNYQALNYAIHRTGAMQAMLSQVDRVQTLLTQELLSSCLVLMAGGVARLPRFYMARNTNESIATDGWHPHQFLARDPASLFREYAAYRSVVLEHLSAEARCRERYSTSQMERVLDLVHLKYLAPMICSPVTDYLIDQSLRPDSNPSEVIAGVWSTFFRNGGATAATRGLSGYLRRLRRLSRNPQRMRELLGYPRRLAQLLGPLRFQQKLGARPAKRVGDMRIDRSTRDGRPRRYRLTREFLSRPNVDGRQLSAAEIRSLVEQLDDYV